MSREEFPARYYGEGRIEAMRRDTRLLHNSMNPNPNTLKRLLSPTETRSELRRKIARGRKPLGVSCDWQGCTCLK
jgi:hypothetical protein